MHAEQFTYDNRITRAFLIATLVWGAVGMLVGVVIAFQLFTPELSAGLQYITYGRIRPLHTNAVIFAFVGNAIFMGVYYSLVRLCKTSRLLMLPLETSLPSLARNLSSLVPENPLLASNCARETLLASR